MENDKTYIKSEAILRIGQRLNIPFALLAGLAFLVPKPAADVMYDQARRHLKAWHLESFDQIAYICLWPAYCAMDFSWQDILYKLLLAWTWLRPDNDS